VKPNVRSSRFTTVAAAAGGYDVRIDRPSMNDADASMIIALPTTRFRPRAYLMFPSISV